MHQADADGADALRAEELRGRAHALLVERAQLLPAEIEPAADLADELQRHDAVGLHPEIGIAVALRHRLAGDLEDVAEARGDDQAERIDLALQQRVGGDRGAVGKADDCRWSRRLPAKDLVRRRAPGRCAGLAGVLATLVTRIAPDTVSTETISVKVPPVSMPMRRRAAAERPDMLRTTPQG